MRIDYNPIPNLVIFTALIAAVTSKRRLVNFTGVGRSYRKKGVNHQHLDRQDQDAIMEANDAMGNN